MTKKLSLALAVSALLALASVLPAQSLQSLVRQPPGGAFLAFQLTDGTVIRGYDEAGNVITTHEQAGDFREV